jgi:ribonuclease VapC
MVAIMTNEDEAFDLERRCGEAGELLSSAIAVWEAARAVARKRSLPVSTACAEVETFVLEFDIRIVPIGTSEARAAAAVHDRFGKGMHRANLNMGDCFAYACATANNAKLLYKGNDFAQTDLA